MVTNEPGEKKKNINDGKNDNTGGNKGGGIKGKTKENISKINK